MSGTTYSIEHAKSARSTCKKCKTKIESGELRIKQSAEGKEGFEVSTYVHVECFSLPRKFASGAGKISEEDFVKDVLEDPSGEILPAMADEIAAKITAKAPSSAKKAAKAGGDEDSDDPMTAIKELSKKREAEGNTGEEPSNKKAKGNMTLKVDAYEFYKGMTNDLLKDVLRWNHQTMTGNKNMLLYKCIDGHVYGRLARCPMCNGVLKMHEDLTKIVCNGKFDEDTKIRYPCNNSHPPEEAPRWLPWYSEEPSDEQKAEMEQMIEEAAGETKAGSHDDDIETLKKAASGLEWKLTGKAGIKKAVGDLLEVLQAHANALDLPEDPKEARSKLGSLIQMHRDKSVEEIIPLIVEELGFKGDKDAKAAKKEAAVENICKNPKNVHIVSVIQELSELYYKEGNRNAGLSYSKAVMGLKDVDYEITSENAMSMCKGKTKVDGVGKGTAEKVTEFLKTGKIEKLEEKRAAVGG
uniref:PARP-type domain-containing protein n=1 Tax=Amphora coffeiformis TaxID=265554 RepID=A0A7S3L535_9STRA|mmetsp:Transcript_10511/g.20172  ORF Transcript_10511/g.20172 Transcript_10511/m.20172 type:complete len:468 (+) Transcript_10511:151-1554(+)